MPGAVHAVDRSLVCSDGVELVARLWSPAAGGPWPVLLMRQPYGRAIASTPTYAHPRWYASHGFLVVVQDVRGTGASGGSFGGFAQEARDSAETVLWARQLPGSSGRLGTYGFSYQGLTQLLNHDPAQRADALPDALAPAMCGLDECAHWCASGGAHWWALSLAWGLQLAALQCRRRGDSDGWHQIRLSLTSQRFVDEGLALLQRLDPGNMVLGWLMRDPATPESWSVHPVDPGLWSRPMLLIGGWHDPHLAGVLDLYQRATASGGRPWLRIGAWSHLNWQGGLDRLQLDFFSHHLRDHGSAGPPWQAPRQQLQDLGNRQWLSRDPAQGSAQRWHLHSCGLAAIDRDEGLLSAGSGGAGTVVIVHDPWRPHPGRGGHLGLDAGSDERRDLDDRSDVACFTTEPLEEAMELCGQPQLGLHGCADQPGFDLWASLARIAPGGEVWLLSSGVARFVGASCTSSQRRQVSLQPLVCTVARGDRLRLSIALAAWPQIAVNAGDGTLACSNAGPAHRVITVELTLEHSSFSILPMVGAN